MSFARNFALGQQIAKEALDTYYAARERKRLEDIASAKPEEIQNAYTSQDAEQLQAIANAKDPNGNPYYTLTANQDGSYGIKPNFSYADSSGDVVAPSAAVAAISPRSRVVEFLGNRYAPEDLTDARTSALRARAMADVVAERDPALGLQIRRSVDAEERDAARFAWEAQQQPLRMRALETQVGSGEIDLRSKQRTEEARKLVDQVYQMPMEAIKIYAGQVNLNTSNLPFLLAGQTKDGYRFIHIDPKTGVPTGKEFTLSDDQLRKTAAAYVLGSAGYGVEADKLLSEVNKEIAELVKDQNKLLIDATKVNNDAVESQNAASYRRAALGLQAQQNVRRELREFIDDKGNVVVVDISQLPVGENGVVSLPSGLRPKTARPDGEPGLTFNKLDDGGVFLDKRTGAPVGKLDPQLGIVPYGQDPRSDQRLLRTLQEKNIRIATGQTQDGLPTWVYITPSGRAFTTPEEALNPPIRKSDVEDLSGLRQLLEQTRAQLAAAGKSGDQRAIQPLARRVFELDRTLRAAALERFGERADEYLRGN